MCVAVYNHVIQIKHGGNEVSTLLVICTTGILLHICKKYLPIKGVHCCGLHVN